MPNTYKSLISGSRSVNTVKKWPLLGKEQVAVAHCVSRSKSELIFLRKTSARESQLLFSLNSNINLTRRTLSVRSILGNEIDQLYIVEMCNNIRLALMKG